MQSQEKRSEFIPLDVESGQKISIHLKNSYYYYYNKSVKNFPIFIISFSIIQVVLFYCGNLDELEPIFRFDPYRRHEVWRFFTVILVHVAPDHLWENIILQLILGLPLEIIHNWKRTAIIYFTSVFGGSLFITILNPTSYGAGASAGYYGLLFAHFAYILTNWNETKHRYCRVIFLSTVLTYAIGSSIYLDLVWAITTNHVGHVGGAVFGFLVSILILQNHNVIQPAQQQPWEKKCQIISGTILIILSVLILIVNICFPSYYLNSLFDTKYEESYALWVFKTYGIQISSFQKACEMSPECRDDFAIHDFKDSFETKL